MGGELEAGAFGEEEVSDVRWVEGAAEEGEGGGGRVLSAGC